MEDKKLLIKAIDYCDLYTPNQRKLLSLFVKLAINDVITMNVKSLAFITKQSKPTIYNTIKILEKDMVIEVISKNIPLKMVKLNTAKLKAIKRIYLKTKRRKFKKN
jgi:hypothetical protein